MDKKSIMLLGFIIGLLLMAGCDHHSKVSSEQTATGINPEKIATEKADGAEKGNASWSVMHRGLQDTFEKATIKKGKIYGCYYSSTGIVVAVCDTQTGQKLNEYVINELSEIKSICVGTDEEIAVLVDYEREPCLWKITKYGEMKKELIHEVEDMGSYPSRVVGFLADQNGYYYIWYEVSVENPNEGGEILMIINRIYVLNSDMECVSVEQEKNIVSIMFDENGAPFLLASDQEGYYTRRIRTESRKEYEEVRIEGVELYEMEVGERCAMSREGLLYLKDGAIHLFHLEQARDERLMELAGVGILEEDVIYFGTVGEGVEMIDNHTGMNHTEYTVLTPGKEDQKVEITLGVMSMTPEMNQMVAGFNREQNRIAIMPVIYAEDYDYDAGYQKLQMDLVRGKAPDLIATNGIDVDALAGAGAFMDLYQFLDRDGEFGRDSFVEPVLKAYEVSGKLYQMAPNFFLYTMWAGNDVAHGKQGVDMEGLMALLAENGGDINSIYGFSADESVMRSLCAVGMDEFINWDTGTCNFTGEEFREVLRFAKEYSGHRFDSLFQAIREKEILLVIGNISRVEDYSLWKGIFGQQIDFIGFPSRKGYGTAAYFGEGMAIHSKTDHPEECWEFVRAYVTARNSELTGFPILRDALEERLEASMREEYDQFVDGNVVKRAKMLYEERKNKNARVVVYKASESDVDEIRKLIEHVSGKHSYHGEIMNIIEEEAEGYLKGNKTLEQVMAVIQNRVQLYLNENKES